MEQAFGLFESIKMPDEHRVMRPIFGPYLRGLYTTEEKARDALDTFLGYEAQWTDEEWMHKPPGLKYINTASSMWYVKPLKINQEIE